MASREQALASAALNSFLAAAETAASASVWPTRPRFSFFTLVVAFSMLEAPPLRKDEAQNWSLWAGHLAHFLGATNQSNT